MLMFPLKKLTRKGLKNGTEPQQAHQSMFCVYVFRRCITHKEIFVN